MRYLLILLLIPVLAAACGEAENTPTPANGGPTPVSVIATPIPEPTVTPIPQAATVNGQPIYLNDYQNEVARFEAGVASLGRDLSQEGDYRQRVLDALIDKTLILQAAAAAGITLTDVEVQAAYDQAVAERGGQAQFDAWLAANLYTADQFRAELRDGILTAAVQSQIADAVPNDVEQVHARHILVATIEETNLVLADLGAGADFATLAVERSLDQSSRINGGDLGWFPPTGLTVKEVADAAFSLQPGETSGVVQSQLGYHIVQTLERGLHPLSPAARAFLQQQALDAWRADLRAKAAVEMFVP
ncbi:MAG: peptidylprolyl isomerase [Chloroflexi bacterium]|nr:peptidylprolyl isomerase [Chloroflexota bacterium]